MTLIAIFSFPFAWIAIFRATVSHPRWFFGKEWAEILAPILEKYLKNQGIIDENDNRMNNTMILCILNSFFITDFIYFSLSLFYASL